MNTESLLSTLPTKVLTLEEEVDLAQRGEAEQLALHSLRAAFLYGRACYHALDEGAVLSACYDGLLAAAKSFQANKIRFFGHAKPYVRGALYKAWKSQETVVKKGSHEALPEPQVETDGIDPNALPYYEKQPEEPHVLPDFDAIQMRDEWARVAPAVKKVLSPQQNIIFDLHYRGGLNFREIGGLLKLTRAAIQYSHRLALKKIRLELMRKKRYKR